MPSQNQELRALRRRVEALERRLAAQAAPYPEKTSPPEPDDFEWPVKGDEGEPPEEGKVFFTDLRKQLGEVKQGLISIYGGVYRFAPGKNLYWHSRQSNHPLKLPLIECSDKAAVRFASVFSSVQRRRLMEAMVGAVQSSGELRAKTRLGSGALYHHLRQLTHAGFAESRGRGRYTLTAEGMKAIITLLHVAREPERKPRSRKG